MPPKHAKDGARAAGASGCTGKGQRALGKDHARGCRVSAGGWCLHCATGATGGSPKGSGNAAHAEGRKVAQRCRRPRRRPRPSTRRAAPPARRPQQRHAGLEHLERLNPQTSEASLLSAESKVSARAWNCACPEARDMRSSSGVAWEAHLRPREVTALSRQPFGCEREKR